MKLGIFSRSYEEMGQSNKMLLFAVLALSIAVLMLAWKTLGSHDRIVLTPPYIDGKMEIAWNSANQNYFKGLSFSIATNVGNITPDTSTFVLDNLALLMSKDVYSRVKPQILAYINDEAFKRGTVFSYFSPTRVYYEDKVDKVFVTGILTTEAMSVSSESSGRRMTTKAVTYEMKWAMNNGRPVMTEFNSYEGKTPRTSDWLRKNEKRLEEEAKKVESAQEGL